MYWSRASPPAGGASTAGGDVQPLPQRGRMDLGSPHKRRAGRVPVGRGTIAPNYSSYHSKVPLKTDWPNPSCLQTREPFVKIRRGREKNAERMEGHIADSQVR